ncbi:hypothetical protein ABPG73_011723 [Tetrahymena malaccensis]
MASLGVKEQEECKVSITNIEETKTKKESCDKKQDMWKFNQVNWPEQLKKLTFKTKYIKVDQNLYDFLEEDGIYIHPRYQKNSSQNYLLEKNKDFHLQKQKNEEEEENNEQDDSFNQDCDDEDHDFKFRIFSKEFEEQIKETFDDFESVFVKLNWRSPRDTENWLHGLQIDNLEDLLTVLKSSGILAELLEEYKDQFGLCSTINTENQFEQVQQQIDSQMGLYLILKKWYNLHKHMMVRCFVRNKKLIAISQRHCSSVNRTIEEFGELFSQKINSYFYEKIAPFFEESNYVFDLYIGIAPNYKLRLLDINPWRGHTNPLLLDWDQLEKIDTEEFGQDKKIFIQYVRTESDVIIEDLSAYRVPEDMLFDGDNAQESMDKVFDYLNIHNKDLYQ